MNLLHKYIEFRTNVQKFGPIWIRLKGYVVNFVENDMLNKKGLGVKKKLTFLHLSGSKKLK